MAEDRQADVWAAVREAEAYQHYLDVQKINDVSAALSLLSVPVESAPPRTDLPLSLARSFG